MTVTRKKLIEVALPLEAINAASAREKSIRHGHPSTLHLWWARRPLAAARAVIFAQMIDDPSACPEEFPTEEAQEAERQRLFRLIEQLVLWENTTNETVLQMARDEIWKSWRRTCSDNEIDPRAAELFNRERLPAFHDPFAGGGSLPLEAQRLGLEAHASDLNPVAVLINKAMIEIPPKFAGRPPVNPESRAGRGSTTAAWEGAAGLAEDVRYYGKWMRDEAEKRIGHLYPKVPVTAGMVAERPDLKPYVGRELTVIAWIWARTVKSPDPSYSGIDVPLASTFVLSNKPGKEAYVLPVRGAADYRFTVKIGKTPAFDAAKTGTKLPRANFSCLMSGTPISSEYIKAQGQAHRMGARLMAIVAEGNRERVYLQPAAAHEETAARALPGWIPEGDVPARLTGGTCVPYGLARWSMLFTARQLVAMTTFTDLLAILRNRVEQDALVASMPSNNTGLNADGAGALAYAQAISVYLAFAVDKSSVYWSSLCPWLNQPKNEIVGNMFGRQAFPMIWDFAEANPFSDSGGNIDKQVEYLTNVIDSVLGGTAVGFASPADAAKQTLSVDKIISTDPPYYDNIGYADLSDFFYVWLRHSLNDVYPELFSTLAVPKLDELVAIPHRHGSKDKADTFFMNGMELAMNHLSELGHTGLPITIYYAFKQAESDDSKGISSTGWETFLDAVIRSGLAISGSWPIRTERPTALKVGTNALASCIVLSCRRRPSTAPEVTRTEFLQELGTTIRQSLPLMTSGQIAPVDLAQASIGPGMAVYSTYSKVFRQDGKPVTVREALQDINSAISAYRTERTTSFDQRTRFCIDFYDQFGFSEADFDNATVLARAQAVGVDTLENEHILVAERGRASLVHLVAYPVGIAGLERGFRGSAWEACMRLTATLQEEGEAATAGLARELGDGICARARELAVWLFTIADARKRTQDALAFNALDASWPEIQRLMASMDRGQQGRLT